MNKDTSKPFLYLDDLKIGDRFVTGSYALDETEIKEFAKKYDPQPFHLDNEAAKNSMFKGLAASGWHTAAISMRLLVTSGIIADGLIGAGTELNWPKPTRPGDILHVESVIIDIKPSKSKPDRGIVTTQNDTLNQHGDIVQHAIYKAVAFRRPTTTP